MRKPWGSVTPGVVMWLVVAAGAGLAGCRGGAESRLPDAGAVVVPDAAMELPPRPDVPAADMTGAAGASGTLKEIAAACGAPGECASNHCFDGVCCRSECPGPCQSCSVAGTVGTCVNTPVGTDPRNDCADEGVASCGGDGTCDGTGACALYAAGTICRPQSCSVSTVTHAARCDGTGDCAAAVSDSCGQYLCNASSCRSTCASNADCVPGAVCVNGSCGPKPPGAPCTAAADCASGNCAQGLCCATACAGTCKSCAIAGSEGQCINVPSGADPLNQCADEGGQSCGSDGTCDGAGACRPYAGGTMCGAATCTAATATPARTCNGSGICLVVISTPCSPYACGAIACRTSCNADADCAAPNVCIASVCGPRGTGGAGGGGGGTAGTTGSAGTGGATGVAGRGGAGGTTGTAGRGGTTGAAGAGGTTGMAGAGGTTGTAGRGGTTGTGGIAGAGGTTGTAGAGGTTGTAGRGGTTGAAGATGGRGGGSGAGGTGGAAGCPGYVFCDDFEDGNANGWTPSGGTWSVITDGTRVYQGGNGNSMSLAGQSSWTDQTITARMKVLQFGGTSTSYRAGIVARATDTTDLYVFAMDASGAMRLLKGTSSPAGDGASGTCGKVIVGGQVNTWYTLRMTIAGTGSDVLITTYLDGTQIHDCQTSMSTLSSGAAGAYIYGPNTIAEFDDVRISLP